jgi:pantoate--beta-alanine ligase
MPVIQYKDELQTVLKEKRNENHTIGFVPTMGALHKGHISLVRKALLENKVVVVSIFVNPTQFDNSNDLEKYPRSLNEDEMLLQNISKDILIFAPTENEMYSGEVTSKKYNFEGLEKVMEGSFRKGHFDGVATIVELLLKAVAPDRAYFGEKDFQQLQIIKKLVAIENIPVEIIPCSILREENGLAMSSRNQRLSIEVRNEAGIIYSVLKTVKSEFGMKSVKNIKDWVHTQFKKNPMFQLEYFEITDVETLNPVLKKQKLKKYRAFISVYANDVRLIDNIALN